jgi:hypothetical protein
MALPLVTIWVLGGSATPQTPKTLTNFIFFFIALPSFKKKNVLLYIFSQFLFFFYYFWNTLPFFGGFS